MTASARRRPPSGRSPTYGIRGHRFPLQTRCRCPDNDRFRRPRPDPRAAFSQGYCVRMNFVSVSERALFIPAELPSVVQLFGIGYIMIECQSSFVPAISFDGYCSNMLCSIVALSQLLGGPDRSAITAALFHLIVLTGFWCSWISPRAWPNSCKMTRLASSSLTSGVNQPKFIVG